MTEIPWSIQSGYPILAFLQLLPLAAIVMLLGLSSERRVHSLAFGFATLELLLAVDLYLGYEQQIGAMQFAEWFSLAGPFGYHAAADGITVLFVLCNALLTLLVVIYAPLRGIESRSHLFAVLFALEATLMSLLLTVDLLWFTLMSTVQLLLIGYLLRRRATPTGKDMALTRFLQFMLIGILLLLSGTIILGWNYALVTGGVWSFDLFDLTDTEVAEPIRSIIFFLLFFGLAVRTPLFPVHGWLPVIAEHGSVAIALIFLLGIKTGLYAMLRFVFPLLPEAVSQWHGYVVAFAIAGIIYAAILAFHQINLHRLLAFTVISHTSVLVIGFFALGEKAIQGSVVLTANFGLALTVLLLMTGLIYRRTQTLLLSGSAGLFKRIPVIGIAFIFAGLTMVGIPGTLGFNAARLVLEDSIHRLGAVITITATIGNIAVTGFLFWAFRRAFCAPSVQGCAYQKVVPASFAEKMFAITLILILLGTGFYALPWLALIEQPVQVLHSNFKFQ